jgi:hypothetical protein
MGLHGIKKLLHNTRNGHQIEKSVNGMEKIFASYLSDKGLITRIYRKLKN